MTETGWEKAAAGVEFPVAVLMGGVDSSPRVAQWGGEGVNPDSVTLRYAAEDIQVTTYGNLMWGEFSPWKDLEAFVEDSFGFVRKCQDLEPPRLEEPNVSDEIKRSKDDQATCTTYRPLPEEIGRERQRKRKQASMNADHKVVDLLCDGSKKKAIVVGELGKWAAGCEVSMESTPLCVLLTGGAVSVESLKLGLVYDLRRHLSSD